MKQMYTNHRCTLVSTFKYVLSKINMYFIRSFTTIKKYKDIYKEIGFIFSLSSTLIDYLSLVSLNDII